MNFPDIFLMSFYLLELQALSLVANLFKEYHQNPTNIYIVF